MIGCFVLLSSLVGVSLAADCFNGNINSYNGDIGTTVSGAKCLQWDDTDLKSETLGDYRKGILKTDSTTNVDKCRLPHPNSDQPWCFTISPSKYELCTVPTCRIGCYKDTGDRDLPSDIVTMSDMTLQKCRDHCLKAGRLFAAAQNGQTCSCGDMYGKHGPAFSEDCNTPCAGASNETCGGATVNLVIPTGHVCMTDNPCRYGGRCTPAKSLDSKLRIGGDYTCSCLPGYEGKNCEKVTSCYADNFCKNGGTCLMSDTSTPYCQCTAPFVGKKACSFCEEIKCMNGGTCRESNLGTYKCQCPLEYRGEFCETLVDYCAGKPCQSGGTCTNYGFTYRCRCEPGFSGGNCEKVSTSISDNLCYKFSCKGKSPCLSNHLQEKRGGFCERGEGLCYIQKVERVGGDISWESGCDNSCTLGVKKVDGITQEVIQCCDTNKCNADDFGIALARTGAGSIRATVIGTIVMCLVAYSL